MTAFAARVLRVYVRDPMSVFFSLLSPLILLVLYLAFFGTMMTNSFAEGLPAEARGVAANAVAAWVVAGLVAVTAISAPIVGLSLMGEDRESGRLDDFLVAPVKARDLVGGYLLATALYTLAVTALVLAGGLGYLAVKGARMPTMAGVATLVGEVVLASAIFAAMMCWIGLSLPSTRAAAGAGTMTGTLSGFLAGAYIPPGELGAAVVSVMNLLPFAPGAVLVRRALAAEPFAEMGDMGARGMEALRAEIGMDLVVGGSTWPIWSAWLIMAAWGVVFAFGAVTRVRTLRR